MVLLLNGTSSSGKSTLAKHLLKSLDEPFVFHSFDSLVPILLPHQDSFEPVSDEQSRTYIRKLDKELFTKMQRTGLSIVETCYRFVPVLLDCGFSVIVETIFWDGVLNFFMDLLTKYPDVYFIGVHCPLEESEKRESARKIRKIGNARRQHDEIHMGKVYDVEVNTHSMSYEECTQQIVNHVRRNKPVAFYKDSAGE